MEVGCLPAAKSCHGEVFALGTHPGGGRGSKGTFLASSAEQGLNVRALPHLGSWAHPHSSALPAQEPGQVVFRHFSGNLNEYGDNRMAPSGL